MENQLLRSPVHRPVAEASRRIAGLVIIIALFTAACGGAEVLVRPEGTPIPEPIRLQPKIVDVKAANDVPVAITIELEDGTRLLLRLGDSVDLEDWGLEHLEGHRRTGVPFFVTYEERSEEFVAVELSE